MANESTVVFNVEGNREDSQRSRPEDPPPYPGPPQTNVPPVFTQQPISIQPYGVATRPTFVNSPMGPVMMMVPDLGPNPTVITCKSCNNQILTKVITKPNIRTHLYALTLFLLGCWPCILVPYCTTCCMNADHSCPNCNSYIGSYKG